MKMTTVRAAKSVKDGSLDFVFLDADHSYDAVKMDIQAWLPKIRVGGIFIGHDWNWPTVKHAAQESFSDIETAEDNLWFVNINEQPSGTHGSLR